VLIPSMIALCACIYMLRFFIVPLLFSSRFVGVTDLFLPQLTGDVFKVASYLVTYAFLATGHYKLSMAAELAQAALFWFLSTRFGLGHRAIGVAWSYATAYLVYFAMIVGTFAVLLKRSTPSRESLP
jgi:hypothetical protein